MSSEMAMASEHHSQCLDDANFAIICSFIEQFGELCHIGDISFSQLQEMLENTNEVPLLLVQLHIRLLRRVFKSINTQKWEKSVSKFAHMFNNQDGWEIERFGYKKSKIQTKLRILKNLLESQFDYNNKFKGEVNKLQASALRLVPLGRDSNGNSYWYQVDADANLRVYREDIDEETWDIVASTREELEKLISQLKLGEIRQTKTEDDAVLDEDTNGLENLELDAKDILLDTGKIEDEDGHTNGVGELSDDDLSDSLAIFEGDDDIIDSPDENLQLDDIENSGFSELTGTIDETDVQDSSDIITNNIPSLSSHEASSKNIITTSSTVTPPTTSNSNSTITKQYKSAVESDNVILTEPKVETNKNDANIMKTNVNTTTTTTDDLKNSAINLDVMKRDKSTIDSSVTVPQNVLLLNSSRSSEDQISVQVNNTEMHPIIATLSNINNSSDGNDNLNVQSVNILKSNISSSSSNNSRRIKSTGVTSLEPIPIKEEECKNTNETTEQKIKDEIPMEIDDDEKLKQSPYFQNITQQQKKNQKYEEEYDSPYFHNVSNEEKSNLEHKSSSILPVLESQAIKPKDIIENVQHCSKSNEVSIKDSKKPIEDLSETLDVKKEPKDLHTKPINISTNTTIPKEKAQVQQIPIVETVKQEQDTAEVDKNPLKDEKLLDSSNQTVKSLSDLKVDAKSLATSLQQMETVPESSSLATVNPKSTSIHSTKATPYAHNIDSMLSHFDKVPTPNDKNWQLNFRTTEHANLSVPPTYQNCQAENFLQHQSMNKQYHSFYNPSPTTGNQQQQSALSSSSLSSSGENNDKNSITEISGKIINETVCSSSSVDFISNKESHLNQSKSAQGSSTTFICDSTLTAENSSLRPKEKDVNNKAPEDEDKISTISTTTSSENINSSKSLKSIPTLPDSSTIIQKQEKVSVNNETIASLNVSEPKQLDSKEANIIETTKPNIENTETMELEKTTTAVVEEKEKVDEKSKETSSESFDSAPESKQKQVTTKEKDNSSAICVQNTTISKSNEGISLNVANTENPTSITDPIQEKQTFIDKINETEPIATNTKTIVTPEETIQSKENESKTTEPSSENTTQMQVDKQQQQSSDTTKICNANKAEVPPSKSNEAPTIDSNNKKQENKVVETKTKSPNFNGSNSSSTSTQNKIGLVGYDDSSSDNEEEQQQNVEEKKEETSTESFNTPDLALIQNKDPSVVSSSSGSQKRKLEQVDENNASESNSHQKEAKNPKLSSDPIVGEAIEEDVFIVTGAGEGALNEGGNNNNNHDDDGHGGKNNNVSSETLSAATEGNLQNVDHSAAQLNSSMVSTGEESDMNNISVSDNNPTATVKQKGRGRPRKNPPKEVLKDNNKKNERNSNTTPEVKSASNSRRNSFADDVNGLSSSSAPARRSGRVAQIRQKEEEERRQQEEQRLAQLKEAQIKKQQQQLERELKVGTKPEVKTPKVPKIPKTPKPSIKAPKAPKTTKGLKRGPKPKAKTKEVNTYIPQSESEDDSESQEEDEGDEYDGKTKGGKKKQKRKAKNGKGVKRGGGATPWCHSSSEDEAVEEEEEHYEEEEEEELVFNNSDHEFSPESDLEEDEFSPSRHARTAKQKDTAVDKYAETYCKKCGKGDHPDWILLCDSCDEGWHASCVYPQLWVIPEGEWFCPPCEHNMLVGKLSENLVELDKLLKKRDNENLRKQRLQYISISLNNVLPSNEKGETEENENENEEDEDKHQRRKGRSRRIYSDEELENFINDGEDDDGGSRSGSGSSYESEDEPMYQLRARRATKGFSFQEYDDMINTALRDDSLDEQEQEVKSNGHESNNESVESPPEYGKGKGKSISNGESESEHEKDEKKKVKFSKNVQKRVIKDSDETDEEELDEKEKNRRKMIKQSQRKNKRRLNDLDATSEEDSDEDFKGSDVEDDDEDAEDVVEDDSEWTGDESDDSIAMAKLRGKKHRKHRNRPLGRQERDSEEGGRVRRSTRRRKSRVIYDESDQEDDDEDQADKWQSGESDEEEEMSEDSDSESDDETWGKKKKQKKAQSASGKSKLQELFMGSSATIKPKKKKRRKVDEDDVDRAWTNKVGSKKKLTDEPVERKTRGRQINFKDILDSGESDDDGNIRPKRRRILSDSDEDSEEPSSSRKLAEEIKASNIRAAAEEKLQHEQKMKELAEVKKKLETENAPAVNKISEDPSPLLPSTIPNVESMEKEIPIKITNSIVESIMMRKSPVDLPIPTPIQHSHPLMKEEIPSPIGLHLPHATVSNIMPPMPPISMPLPHLPIQNQQQPPPLLLPQTLPSLPSGSARVGKKKTASMIPTAAQQQQQQQHQSGTTLPFPSSSKKSSSNNNTNSSSSNNNGSPSKTLAAALTAPVTSSPNSIPRPILPPNMPSELLYANNPALRPFHPSAWGRTPPPYPNLGKPPPLHSNSASFMQQQLRPPSPFSQSPPPGLRIPNPGNPLQAFQQFTKRSSGDLGSPLYRMPSHQLPPSVLPSMRERERIFLGGSSPYSPYGMLPAQGQQQHPGLFPPPFDYRAAESFKDEMLERQQQSLPSTMPTPLSSHPSVKDEGNPGEFSGLVSYFSSQHSNDED